MFQEVLFWKGTLLTNFFKKFGLNWKLHKSKTTHNWNFKLHLKRRPTLELSAIKNSIQTAFSFYQNMKLKSEWLLTKPTLTLKVKKKSVTPTRSKILKIWHQIWNLQVKISLLAYVIIPSSLSIRFRKLWR